MAEPSVIVVGTGPTGLWLAWLLRKAGVDVAVISPFKSRQDRDPWSKALSLSAGSLATLNWHGLGQTFSAKGLPQPSAHFGMLPTRLTLDYETLGIEHCHTLIIPQAVTENTLLDECEKLNVRFVWNSKLLRVKEEQGAGHVVVTVERQDADGSTSEAEMTGKWVVGCDGTHSATRQAAGIDFEGHPSTIRGIMADFQLNRPYGFLAPPKDAIAKNSHELKPMVVPIGDGRQYRFVTLRKEGQHSDGLKLDEIKDELVKHYGSDYGAHSVSWTTTFGSAFRVASTFRKGRVLIAGDAAHQFFPAGGQGMNLGIQDSTNLAWKLALAVAWDEQGKTPAEIDRLLDSYTRERLRAAQDTVHNALAQMLLITAQKPAEFNMRDVMSEALQQPALNKLWARRTSGFGEATDPYHPEGAVNHSQSLVGVRLSYLQDEDLYRSIKEVMQRPDRFVLLVFPTGEGLGDVWSQIEPTAQRWDHHVGVCHVPSTVKVEGTMWENVMCALVRPDERITWSANAKDDAQSVISSLEAVLTAWLGSH